MDVWQAGGRVSYLHNITHSRTTTPLPPHPHHLVEITLALTFPGGESSEIIEWAPYEGSV